MTRARASLGAVCAVLLVAGTLLAHHGEANYDTTKIVSVKGTVTSFEFINPHTQISLDVKNEQGEIEHWVAEAKSPNSLVRQGWDKDILKAGDVITASGHRAKNAKVLRLLKVVLPDGREMGDL